MMSRDYIIQAIVSGVLMGLIYALVAVGLSLIFGLMEIVNFAHGEFLMFAMFASFWFWVLPASTRCCRCRWWPPCSALPALLVHYGIIRRLLKAPMLAQVCGTFGLAVALRAGAQFLWTPDFRTITNPLIAGRVQIGPIFIGQPQLLAGCNLPAVVRCPVALRHAHRDRPRPAGDVAGPAGGRRDGHSDRAHVGARLGDRARLRRRGRHACSRRSSTSSPTLA